MKPKQNVILHFNTAYCSIDGKWLSVILNFSDSGIAVKRGGDIFQGVCSFYIKNKLKFEISNNKNISCHNEEFKPENFN